MTRKRPARERHEAPGGKLTLQSRSGLNSVGLRVSVCGCAYGCIHGDALLLYIAARSDLNGA